MLSRSRPRRCRCWVLEAIMDGRWEGEEMQSATSIDPSLEEKGEAKRGAVLAAGAYLRSAHHCTRMEVAYHASLSGGGAVGANPAPGASQAEFQRQGGGTATPGHYPEATQPPLSLTSHRWNPCSWSAKGPSFQALSCHEANLAAAGAGRSSQGRRIHPRRPQGIQ